MPRVRTHIGHSNRHVRVPLSFCGSSRSSTCGAGTATIRGDDGAAALTARVQHKPRDKPPHQHHAAASSSSSSTSHVPLNSVEAASYYPPHVSSPAVAFSSTAPLPLASASNMGSGAGIAGQRGARFVQPSTVTKFLHDKYHAQPEDAQASAAHKQAAAVNDNDHDDDDDDDTMLASSPFLPRTLTPRTIRWKQNFIYANIRPETADKWRRVEFDARGHEVESRSPAKTTRTARDASSHDANMVRKALKALCKELGDYNYRTWLKHHDNGGHSHMSHEQLRNILHNLDVGPQLTPPQLDMVEHVIFEGDRHVDYQSFISRVKLDRRRVPDAQQYLQHFAHLPPAPSMDATPSSLDSLKMFHTRLHTHGLSAVFRALQHKSDALSSTSTSHDALVNINGDALPQFKTPRASAFHVKRQGCSYASFDKAIKKMGLNPDGLVQLLDHNKKGYLEYGDLQRLFDTPSHQLASLYNTLNHNNNNNNTQSQQHTHTHNHNENQTHKHTPSSSHLSVSHRDTTNNNNSSHTSTNAAAVEEAAAASSDASSAASSSSSSSSSHPALTIPIPALTDEQQEYHPMFMLRSPRERKQLINEQEYKTIREQITERKNEQRSVVPPLFQSVLSARSCAGPSLYVAPPLSYSVDRPPLAPTRLGLTPSVLHTPCSELGGVGRPISAQRQPKVGYLAQRRRDFQQASQDWTVLSGPAVLAPIDTFRSSYAEQFQAPSARTRSRAHQAASAPPLPDVHGAAPPSSLTSRASSNPFYQSEAERFSSRDPLSIQREDRQRRDARLACLADRVDRAEQRVLRSYESEQAEKHAKAAHSLHDKIQQKANYMRGVQAQHRENHEGKMKFNEYDEKTPFVPLFAESQTITKEQDADAQEN